MKTKKAKSSKKLAVAKKTATKKVAPKKKIAVKKVAVKSAVKRIPAKKLKIRKSSSKANGKPKALGIFAIISGLFGVVALAFIAFPTVYSAIAPNDSNVLGVSTKLAAPANFKATIENYNLKLSWDRVTGAEEYKVMIRNITDKTYSIGIAWNTAMYVDHKPGTTIAYKAFACTGSCSFRWSNGDGSEPVAVDPDQIGYYSSEKIVKMPKLSIPSSVKATSNDSGVKLTWKAINGVDGYNVWRTDSIVGTYSKIGMVGKMGAMSTINNPGVAINGVLGVPLIVAPTTYSDTTSVPGKTYFYKVSSLKRVSPYSYYSRDYVDSESDRSLAKMVIAARLSAPKGFSLTNPSRSSTTASLGLLGGQTSNGFGIYVYCAKCTVKKMDLATSKYLKMDGRGEGVTYELSGLKPSTSYSIQLARYKMYGSTIIEGKKTSMKTIKTPAADYTAAPTGFSYVGLVAGGEIKFKFKVPAKAVAGYMISIDCFKNSQYTGGWNGAEPQRYADSTGYYAFNSIDWEIGRPSAGRGTCTARLAAYSMLSGTRIYSKGASLTFED